MFRAYQERNAFRKSSMSSLTCFGGVNEIGGNKILLKQGNSSVFLDFGVSYRASDQFFDFPLLQPTNLDDLLKTGMIPRLPGLYKNAGLHPLYNPQTGIQKLEGQTEKCEITGILLTHAHQDHYGYLGVVRPDIPIFVSAVTKKMLKLRNTVGGDFRDTLRETSVQSTPEATDFKVGDFRVKRFTVDHSVPGASAFLIYTDSGTVCYTGDLRFHGSNGKLTVEFLEALKKEKPKYLLCEGTRIPSNSEPNTDETESKVLRSEKDVASKCIDLIKSEKGLVIYDASPADVGRLMVLHEVAKQTNRRLVLDAKLAYFALFMNAGEPTQLLEGLPQPTEIEVLLGRRKLASNTKKFKSLSTEDIYVETFDDGRESHERDLIGLMAGKVKWGPGRDDFLAKPGDYILYTSNGPLTTLHLLPDMRPIGGLYIYGKAEPFTEEMEFSFARLLNWLKLASLRLEYAHTSGHIFPDDLARFLAEVQASVVIPIHTLNPTAFEKMTPKVLIPEQSKEINL